MNLYIHAYIQYAVSIPFGNLTVRYGSHDPFSSMIYPQKTIAMCKSQAKGTWSDQLGVTICQECEVCRMETVDLVDATTMMVNVAGSIS